MPRAPWCHIPPLLLVRRSPCVVYRQGGPSAHEANEHCLPPPQDKSPNQAIDREPPFICARNGSISTDMEAGGLFQPYDHVSAPELQFDEAFLNRAWLG